MFTQPLTFISLSAVARAVMKMPEDKILSILRALYPGEVKTPITLNKSHDAEWSYIVIQLLPDAKLCEIHYKNAGAHVFVQLADKFYDPENLEGVTDWKTLKSVKRCLRTQELSYTTVKHPAISTMVKTRMEKGARSRLDRMIEHHQGRVKVDNWDAYTWYTLEPTNGKALLVTDIKGLELDLDPGTKYGALPVKAGIRIVDADDPKTFFILADATFTKLSSKSVMLSRSPIKRDTPTASTTSEPKTHNRPVVVVQQPTEHIPTHIQPLSEETLVDRTFDDDSDDQLEVADVYADADTSNKIIDTDGLQDYNDIDDISVELYGHHLSEFNDREYGELDSYSATYASTSAFDLMGIDAPGVATLGKAYKAFLATNLVANKAQTDSAVAESSMIPIVRALFTHLADLGFEVSALRGADFTKSLQSCSKAIEAWHRESRSSAISHLAIKVNNLVLDPCFKRLGQSVRIDNYALADFQRLWKDITVIASPTALSRAHESGLFTKSAKQLQIPTPSSILSPTSVLASSVVKSKRLPHVTKIKLSGSSHEDKTC